MKKIWSLLIVIILINFILGNFCYATSDEVDTGFFSKLEGLELPVSNESITSMMDEGKADGQEIKPTNLGFGTIMGYVAGLINVFPLTIYVLMSVVTVTDSSNTWQDSLFFSIDKVVFDRVAIFNANFFEFGNYKIGFGNNTETIAANEANTKLKESVAEWFYICRLLAIIISLGTLLVVGIGMALSTIASDKAKYKKMLIAWVEGLIILFLLQYIIMALLEIGKFFNDVCFTLRGFLIQSGEQSFEEFYVNELFNIIKQASGFRLAQYSVMFWALVYVQVKFFLTYMWRFLSIGFLIAISPFITVTYPIDKMGDNRAQGFSKWMQEFMVNVFIQPLHAIIYLVFVFSAGEIAKNLPIVGIIILLALGRVEKIVKSIFSMRGMVSIKSMDGLLKKKK